jgi:DNA-directed RNA polymerase specialized sigma24 family protein
MDRPRSVSSKKVNWKATEGSFRALLEWLDQGCVTNGDSYLEVRQRLVTFFDRKNCLNAEDLADETLNRVERRLQEEGSIESESPAKFCYAIARYVFLEYLKSGRAREVTQELADGAAAKSSADELAALEEARARESALQCLEKCIGDLDEDRRELVLGYYQGEQRTKIENRRLMALKRGLTMNALTIRTFRIRERLEMCVRKCVEKAK